MKRHGGQAESVAAAMEAGKYRAGSGGNASTMPTIQPYQASAGIASSPLAPGNDKARRDRDSWQQTASIGCAVWVIGWFLGYGALWPLNVAMQLLSWLLSFTPLGGLMSWWSSGLPLPEVFPAAQELHLASSKVPRYIESYAQNYGDAAVIFAAHDGYAQVVAGLLTHKDLGYGELVDAADETGHTALLYAAGRGFPQVSAALLRGGAEPDASKQGKEGRGLTALMQAAGSGQREIVTLLLRANATVDLQDEAGNSALMYAAYGGHLGCIQELLQQGAMRDLVNKRGDTALSMATAKGTQAVADALQRGARPVLDSNRRSGRGAAASKREREAKTPAAASKDVKEAKAKEEEDSQGLLKALGLAGAKEPEPQKAKAEEKEVDSTQQSLLKALQESLTGGSSQPEKADDGAADKRVKQLEAKLAEIEREREASDLKTQRRVVELLEASTDKQKLLDKADEERRALQSKLDDAAKKLRERDQQESDNEERQAKYAKDAHDARLEAENERARADAAEREKDRQMAESKRLSEDARRKEADAEDARTQTERLREQVRSLRKEADQAQEERREAQRQMQALRAAGADARRSADSPAASAAAGAQPAATAAESAPPAATAPQLDKPAAPTAGFAKNKAETQQDSKADEASAGEAAPEPSRQTGQDNPVEEIPV